LEHPHTLMAANELVRTSSLLFTYPCYVQRSGMAGWRFRRATEVGRGRGDAPNLFGDCPANASAGGPPDALDRRQLGADAARNSEIPGQWGLVQGAHQRGRDGDLGEPWPVGRWHPSARAGPRLQARVQWQGRARAVFRRVRQAVRGGAGRRAGAVAQARVCRYGCAGGDDPTGWDSCPRAGTPRVLSRVLPKNPCSIVYPYVSIPGETAA
jgi:hypothetical protein